MFKRLGRVRQERFSTGGQELDEILGGGMVGGDILLLAVNEGVNYHLGIHRVFIAEGLERNEPTIHSSMDASTLSVPAYVKRPSSTTAPVVNELIAWRYGRMSGTSSTARLGGAERSGCFDLRQTHPKSDQVIWAKDLASIITSIKPGSRVSILSMFSPLWGSTNIQTELFQLRAAIRTQGAIALVSIPINLVDHLNYGFFDQILTLEPKPSKSRIRCDGLIEPRKAPRGCGEKYAIKCSSTGVRIEKAILPPE
ncbi:elongator complex protein 4 [Nematocida homosporus]|uniref:elongator complex protein 4 n=1 Tax=Nematocida homosporus TaxID=1912981 RepID=UPI00221EC0F5|nr:elongator complex protein 4 [Nematocida homosporus]KAI5184782.1 elongator complex protein 4 [Nematocida homosporus]